MARVAIVTHGGAGSPVEQSDGPQRAADAGLAVLRGAAPAAAVGLGALAGGGAGDPAARASAPNLAGGFALTPAAGAVIEATCVLEDDERFNAGTGANLRFDGVTCELDASLGTSEGRIGAVACIERVRHPILVAARVLELPHWLIVGAGATALARRLGFPEHENVTARAREKWRKGRAALERRMRGEALAPDAAPGSVTRDYQLQRWAELDPSRFWNFARAWAEVDADLAEALAGAHDTVGAVARDADGRFAAASSTGGTLLMLRGRVGDSPIFGAGFYAGPHGAVTATGLGEEIVRRTLSRDVYDSIAAGAHPMEVCRAAVAEFPSDLDVGVIAVSRDAEGWAANRPMASGHATE